MSQQIFKHQLKRAFEDERHQVSVECEDQADSHSLLSATCNFYNRFDKAIAGASVHVEENIECQLGCSYCCYFRVDVSANEVFAIVDYVQATFSADKLEKITQKAAENKNKLDMLSPEKRQATNMACPLLEDGACSAYNMRPSVCRKTHSTNRGTCQKSYDNPEDQAIQNAEHPVLSAITMMMLTAAREGFACNGRDESIYDLNEVLIASLSDSKYKKRWLSGKKAFP